MHYLKTYIVNYESMAYCLLFLDVTIKIYVTKGILKESELFFADNIKATIVLKVKINLGDRIIANTVLNFLLTPSDYIKASIVLSKFELFYSFKYFKTVYVTF